MKHLLLKVSLAAKQIRVVKKLNSDTHSFRHCVYAATCAIQIDIARPSYLLDIQPVTNTTEIRHHKVHTESVSRSLISPQT